MYQFGGVSGGSTYKAMLNLRTQMSEFKTNSIMLMDMSKGYDSIRIPLMEQLIEEIEDERVRYLLKIWIGMVTNLDYEVNGNRLKRTRGLAMGLSFSPIMFIYYMDCALKNIDKSKISCYIDDIGCIISDTDTQRSKEYVDNLICALKDFDLIINKKKTVIITNNAEVKKIFGDDFPIVSGDKYLGRAVGINGDGRITADNRFYGTKLFRSNACPYWATFGIKRLVFNGAIDASMRYKFFMWSADSQTIRTSIWRNSWCFFSKSFGKFSYFQLSFCAFNYFRYCIDVVDIGNWINQIKQGRLKTLITLEILNKLSVEQKQIQTAIAGLKVDWSILEDKEKNLFSITKRFTNKLFGDFRSNMVNEYFNKKRLEGVKVFPYIGKFITSKLFRNFGFIQNIVFLHSDNKKRAKQIFAFNLLKNVAECVDFYIKEALNNNILDFDLGLLWGKAIEDFSAFNWKDMDQKLWNTWICDKYILLWPLIITLLNLCNKIEDYKMKDDDMIPYHIDENEAIVCSDGAFNEKSQQYGYGGFVEWNGIAKEYIGVGKNINFVKYKNIAGELEGVVAGLNLAISLGCDKINVLYDCKSIEEYALGRWKVNNNEVASWYKNEIINLCSNNKIKIRWTHLTSHTGIVENERVDQLAKKAVGIEVKNGRQGNKRNTISKEVKNGLKAIYKMAFKIFSCGEMILFNNNLSDFSPEELWLNLRVKVCNMDLFTEKIYNVMEFEEKDLDVKEFYE